MAIVTNADIESYVGLNSGSVTSGTFEDTLRQVLEAWLRNYVGRNIESKVYTDQALKITHFGVSSLMFPDYPVTAFTNLKVDTFTYGTDLYFVDMDAGIVYLKPFINEMQKRYFPIGYDRVTATFEAGYKAGIAAHDQKLQMFKVVALSAIARMRMKKVQGWHGHSEENVSHMRIKIETGVFEDWEKAFLDSERRLI